MLMELAGEQKRIQQLFSELRLADEQVVPRFAAVWNRAEARTVRPTRAFSLAFVAAMALLVCALVSLALWSKYSQRSAPQPAVIATGTASPAISPAPVVKNLEANSPGLEGKPHRVNLKSRTLKLAAQRHTLMLAVNRKTAREAKEISSWQSPTSALLKSQNDELLKSLPQLNENADELKSFLPNTPK
ncbi:MAG: hypothetical protein ACMG6H_00270 [Acidobacteriota bacterium]